MSRKPEVLSPRAVGNGGVEDVTPGRPPPWGWTLWACNDGFMHLLPTWDIYAHQHTAGCRCRPMLDAAGHMVHNSFDGRERYERGEARPH